MTRYSNIVILTGAGISAESGLSTFRDQGGLWENHNIEDVATPEAFARNPDLVQNFYNMRRSALGTVEPNAAHKALSRLERDHSGKVLVVTQNVDDLHERAGTKNLVHMHGELAKVRCLACDQVLIWQDELHQSTPCPSCGSVPALRPHIVWFGEMPFQMERIAAALSGADLFISIGTSGNVYPAAGFVAEAGHYGHAHTVELNLEPSEGHSQFAECIHGPAGKLVPAYVEKILGIN